MHKNDKQAQSQTQTFTKQQNSSHDVSILTNVGGATESRDGLHPMKVESMAKEQQELVLRKRNYTNQFIKLKEIKALLIWFPDDHKNKIRLKNINGNKADGIEIKNKSFMRN